MKIKPAQILHRVHCGSLLQQRPWQHTRQAHATAPQAAGRTGNTPGLTGLLFFQEVTQEPKLSGLCCGCHGASGEACPGSAHFPPVPTQPHSQRLAGASWQLEAAVLSFHRQLLFPEKEHAMMWKAAHKRAVGEDLTCLIDCHTQLKDLILGAESLVSNMTQHLPRHPNLLGLLQVTIKLPIKRRFT